MPVVKIEFALAYDPASEDVDYSLWERPWESLLRATSEVDTSTTLAAAGMEGERLLVPPELRSARLDMGGLELGLFVHEEAPPKRVAELNIVDESGRVRWGRGSWTEITYQELLRSFQAGTLPGDPTGLSLMRPFRGAGGAVAAWEAFLITWEALDGVLTAYGLYELGGKIASRVRRGRKTMEKNLPDWQLRGAMTHNFIYLLRQQPWHPSPLGRLLGCSPEEAAAVLELYGYSRGADGLYYPGRDGAEGFLWTLHERIRNSYADSRPAVDPLREMLKAQTESFLGSGGDRSALADHEQRLPDRTSDS